HYRSRRATVNTSFLRPYSKLTDEYILHNHDPEMKLGKTTTCVLITMIRISQSGRYKVFAFAFSTLFIFGLWRNGLGFADNSPAAQAFLAQWVKKNLGPAETRHKDAKIDPRIIQALDPFMDKPTPVMADDGALVKAIRSTVLTPPSNEPYNLTTPDLVDQSMGQAKAVREIFKEKKGGFFIECGALDGETLSNTLVLEHDLGWSGLLVEADPINYQNMMSKHRKSWTVNVCLSTEMNPMKVIFKQDFQVGAIAGKSSESNNIVESGQVEVPCVPLFSLLLALNRTTIDYFSLDVEGAEFSVLKTVPFDKLDIKVLSVEWAHVPEGKEALQKYMEDRGYYLYTSISDWLSLGDDFIFVKKY
ncbi:unnamed protein product, partial [Meganyctiphanes norvegica]